MIQTPTYLFVLGIIGVLILLGISLIRDIEDIPSYVSRLAAIVILVIIFLVSDNITKSKYKYNKDIVDEAIVQYSNEFIMMDSTEQIAIHKSDSSIYQYDKKQGKYIKL